jgi:CopA family copper-resistance protein
MDRRTLLKLAAGAGLAGAGIAWPGRHSFAAASRSFDLTVDPMRITVDGRTTPALAIGGSVPGPVLLWKEGEEVVIHVTNRLPEPTSIHWHGLLLAGVMDGSPGFNGFVAIAPGETYTYRFALRQAGTYWYHSHSGGQEQSGMYGAIVIEPAGGQKIPVDRDYVVLLSDHTSEHPDAILRRLKANPEVYVRAPRTIIDFFRDSFRDGLGATLEDRKMWADMRMSPTDLSDVSGYQFLMNGRGATDNWTGLFKPGERVRLRFINGSAMTFFDVRIPDLKMTVVASDGQDVIPVPVDEFRNGIGETYDVLVNPKTDRAYTIMAEPNDRSGYARGTLAPREGMVAAIPEQRPRAILSMADMGPMEGMDHSSMPGMNHGGMAGMDHSSMAGMDHSKMAMPPGNAAPAPQGAPLVGWDQAGTLPGQKALRYEDLKNLTPNSDARAPTQEIRIVLDGQMNRYNWTLNGKRFDQAQPIRVGYNERVRIRYVNTTMMAHPMHLHGMFVELENGQTNRMPRKHVVIVRPGREASVLLTANEPGDWPFHCHLMYHMNAGMMARFVVEGPRQAARAS